MYGQVRSMVTSAWLTLLRRGHTDVKPMASPTCMMPSVLSTFVIVKSRWSLRTWFRTWEVNARPASVRHTGRSSGRSRDEAYLGHSLLQRRLLLMVQRQDLGGQSSNRHHYRHHHQQRTASRFSSRR